MNHTVDNQRKTVSLTQAADRQRNNAGADRQPDAGLLTRLVGNKSYSMNDATAALYSRV
jgi:hypothetical protein